MCMCARPNINGQPGYSWNGEPPHIRPVAPPPTEPGDVVLFDEPGRCGGLDSHSHHFRLVKSGGTDERVARLYLVVEHGGGTGRLKLDCVAELLVKRGVFERLESDDRYWLMHAMFSERHIGERDGRDQTNIKWRRAAAEKRIKTRKNRGGNGVKVWIEDATKVT